MALEGGLAQALETKELSVPVESRSADARSAAFQEATESLSLELATSRLGSEFLKENQRRFENQVLSQSSKYILSVRSKGYEDTDKGVMMKVELGYSSEAFDRVLRESGLVQLSRQKLRALVLLEDRDQAVGIGPWWARSEGEMKKDTLGIYRTLVTKLTSQGIEVVPAATVKNSLPVEFKKANFNREELLQMGQKFGATLVYFGLLASAADGTIFHGQWIQVPAARILNEVQGKAPNQDAVVEALMDPIKTAQAQGTLNSKPFLLTIEGDLGPKQLEHLKDQLKNDVRDLRSIKERVMRRGKFTFEAESPQSPQALADILKTLSFQDFQHKVSLDGDDEILLQVKKR